MKFFLELPILFRALIGVIFILVSLPLFTPMAFLAYIVLFVGFLVIFEGLGLSLFNKILIALMLGIALSATHLIDGMHFENMKPIGSKIFLNLLTIALVPLVFSSILIGVTHLADMSRLKRIGSRAIMFFLITTIAGVVIGLLMANTFQPGSGMSADVKVLFEQQAAAQAKLLTDDKKITFFEVVQNIVPQNILLVVSQPRPDMLAIIVFAIFCGLALLRMESSKAQPVIAFFDGISEMTIQIINMVMRLAPYGVFTIIGATLSQSQGIEIIAALLPFSMIVIVSLGIHTLLIHILSLKLLAHRPVRDTFIKVKEVLITAFSTASSGATMPLTLKVVEKDLKVRKEVSSFVISLGATINMNGTALFQGVSAVFLANIYGIELTVMDQLMVVAMAVMASVGTAAVPGVGIIMLMMILTSVGVPSEGILFILPVNHILDMFRTVVNVFGDICCALYIERVEQKADR